MRRAKAFWRWLVGVIRDVVPFLICFMGGLLLALAHSAPDDAPTPLVIGVSLVAGLMFMAALDMARSRAKAEETEKWGALLTGMITEERTTEITVTHQYAANREAE